MPYFLSFTTIAKWVLGLATFFTAINTNIGIDIINIILELVVSLVKFAAGYLATGSLLPELPAIPQNSVWDSLIDNTSGTYTILASDSSGNGCIVEYLDIAKYPGKVAFSWSPTTDYRL